MNEPETLGEKMERDIQYYHLKIQDKGDPEDYHVLDLLTQALTAYKKIHK